eukprot:CAMPEP_0198223114 /NCGR_PEP_ID=MMETSP1445-20131203/91048_1 /TAXON_ID=36898 /ORGANISM="Pyramimonas sp., Strain CCMP2087" /LENGTH=50 /DNA_ID=CAMNT_0043901855 /DNA_START=29 /DNA_END=177 /DNA_ORIENTATION=+
MTNSQQLPQPRLEERDAAFRKQVRVGTVIRKAIKRDDLAAVILLPLLVHS